MDVDVRRKADQPGIEDDDLFRAAESGDASVFRSLSSVQMAKLLSLRNEDGRSLLHVAASSGHPEVCFSVPKQLIVTFKIITMRKSAGTPPSPPFPQCLRL